MASFHAIDRKQKSIPYVHVVVYAIPPRLHLTLPFQGGQEKDSDAAEVQPSSHDHDELPRVTE